MTDLNAIVDSAKAAFAQAGAPADLENAKAKFLGKTGHITALMKGLATLPVDEKKAQGAAINVAKQAIEAALHARREALVDAELQLQLQAEALDVSLPGRQRGQGGLHPVSLSIERIEAIFGSMGFEVAQGPEIEADWFNFTALNTPEGHPARSMHDTFYVEGGSAAAPNLLRTHTSQTFFETRDLDIRFRPSFFPFTEPSAEIDIMFGTGPLKGRWLEVSGSGQVHPQVIRNMGLDPEHYIGFAFGTGIDRLTMLRYGVDDLRLFFDGDIRFLSQFQ